MKKINWIKQIKHMKKMYTISRQLLEGLQEPLWKEFDYLVEVLLDEVGIEPCDIGYEILFDYLLGFEDFTAEETYDRLKEIRFDV